MAVELVIVGDEAWAPDAWEAEVRDRKRRAAYKRRQYKAWAAANIEHRRAYKREWQRRKRALERPVLVGSLHSLSCTGPTIATGCVCNRKGTRKIRCYSAPR